MTRPLVSVILPVFNSADTLSDSINSVLAQTESSLELIVCDDASTDATADILSLIKDPRLKRLHNSINLGPGLSRDRAIEAANGLWIAMIDADDVWIPNRLERLLAVAGSTPNRLIFDDIMICHSTRGGLVPWRRLHGNCAFGGEGPAVRDLTVDDYILSPRLLIKPLIPLSAIRASNVHHSSRSFGEDAEFFLQLALSGVGFRYLPQALYMYRVQVDSLTARAGYIEMRECLEACSALDGWSDSTKVAFRCKIASLQHNETLYALRDAVKKGRFFSAIRYLVTDPVVLSLLPSRACKFIMYQLHRIWFRGGRRGD